MEPEPEPEPTPDAKPKPSPSPRPDLIPPLPPETEPEEEDEEPLKCGDKKLPLTKVSFSPGPLGQAGTVVASPLTRCPGNTRGSLADWRVYREQFDCIKKAGLGRRYPGSRLHGMTRRSLLRNYMVPKRRKTSYRAIIER
jgi:hypothetical protein